MDRAGKPGVHLVKRFLISTLGIGFALIALALVYAGGQ